MILKRNLWILNYWLCGCCEIIENCCLALAATASSTQLSSCKLMTYESFFLCVVNFYFFKIQQNLRFLGFYTTLCKPMCKPKIDMKEKVNDCVVD